MTRALRARDGFLADTQADALHRLRVALRRLRALARIARPFLRRPAGLTDRDFRGLGRRLASLRDRDVTLAALRAAAIRATPEDREILGAALDQLLRRRKAELRRVRRAVRGGAARRLFAALEEWKEHARGTALGAAAAERGARALARGIAERLLADRTWSKGSKGHGDASHHRLRRRARRARYQLEALAQILGKEVPRTLGWLVEVQDALGRGQDVAAAALVLRETKRGRAAWETGCMAEWGAGERGRGAAEWDRLRARRVAWKRGVGRELGSSAAAT